MIYHTRIYAMQPFVQAYHTGSDAYLMSVVKPVWNVPMAGTLYWLVTMRGCNADRCV